MQLIKAGAAKGLARKPMAPAFNARARTLSSGKAVIKINGTLLPWARICVRRSKPLIAGHLHIRNDTGRVVQVGRLQELLG